ncbi:MAG: hypothetical protein M3Z96_09990 [Pseudomonadota bacterium]|nr:hypothetical protein [Pseudomonadota bacterium]
MTFWLLQAEAAEILAATANLWVRFCITGHYRQVQTLIRRSQEMRQVYTSRVRNASYRISANISNNLASRDLKALVDVGLLIPQGERRGRHYVASDIVKKVRDRNRLPRGGQDPFAEDEIKPKLIQGSLF